jgi:Rps23 Pro-64 3,4-dihydroxylase Tpa1-like proline 4-hydroxylase
LTFTALKLANYANLPFPHVTSNKALDYEFVENVMEWFEGAAPWNLVVQSFYEQYEFSLLHCSIPLNILALASPDSLNQLRSLVEQWFQTSLSNRVDISAHKLVAGQTIRVHNDYIPGRESHRLLIQINRGWKDENGGLLMLFSSPNPKDLSLVFRPTSNTCIAFEISSASNHAVSQIHGGERFTLVYSFFQ